MESADGTVGWRFLDHRPSRGSMRVDAVYILATSRVWPQCCLLSNRGISDVREDVDLAVTPYTEPQATVCGVVESQDYGVRQDADLQMRYTCIILLLK